MPTLHIDTGTDWKLVSAEDYGQWSVHLTDEIAKERYSVSHRGTGRYAVQDLSYERAIAIAEVLAQRYPDTNGSDHKENQEIVAFCKGFVSPEATLRRRSLSRRRRAA